ncbi:hypothetical protein LTR92_000500 [Exophiala xenobiotica]|nr:hypothetical protein LTR92_000500 [Exophiala xenobiotica]
MHNDPFQAFTDVWCSPNAALIHDLKILHAAVAQLRGNTSFPPLAALKFPVSSTQARSYMARNSEGGYDESPNRTQHRAEHENEDIEAELLVAPSRRSSITESPNRLPIDSLYEITHLRSLRSQPLTLTTSSTAEPKHVRTDIISRGIIQRSDAERLVGAYLTHSDHYLYGIASKYKDMETIRRSSSLLLTAICTVAALQDPTPSDLYSVCHAELRSLVSQFIFKPTVELEDLRGLCIACFWLSNMSWSVSGIAIRRACEIELQKSFYAIVPEAGRSSSPSPELVNPNPPSLAIECMRLWYLFYICDQQLSILYGRTPTLRDQETIQNCESYLAALPASTSDIRIINQVSLLRIMSAVADTFGSNVERRVPVIFKTQLDNFIRQLDHWVTHWLSHCARHPSIGDYTSRAASLHFHFAKLHVCSHVFRGLSSNVEADPIPRVFQDIALMAIQSANSIVDLIVQDLDLRNAFINGIHYFHSMVAHACLFLLKCNLKYKNHFQIDVEDVLAKVEQIILLCKEVPCADYHVINWIGKGLQTLLSSCRAAFSSEATGSRSGEQQAPMPIQDTLDKSLPPFANHSQHGPSSSATLELDGRWGISPQAIFDLGNGIQYGGDFLDPMGFRADSSGYMGGGFGEFTGEYGASQWNRLELAWE